MNINKKIASEAALGVIVLIAVIIGGSIYLQKEEEAQPQPPVQQIPVSVNTYQHPRGFFSIEYPASWSVYEVQSVDTSLGGVNILPASGAALTKKVVNFFDYQGLDPEFVAVGGGFLYADSMDRKTATAYLEELAKNYVEFYSSGSIKLSQEMKYDEAGDPYLETQYAHPERQTKGIGRLFFAKNSDDGSLHPILLEVGYYAKNDAFKDKTAQSVLQSFRENLHQIYVDEEERTREENKDIKPIGYIQISNLDPSVGLSSSLENWPGRVGSQPVQAETRIESRDFLQGQKTVPGFSLSLTEKGATYGVYRDITIPKDTVWLDFCFSYPQSGESDHFVVNFEEKGLMNFSASLAQDEFIGSQIYLPLFLDTTQDLTGALSIYTFNRSGQPIEGHFTDFRFFSGNEDRIDHCSNISL